MKPTRPALRYLRGKWRLAPWIIEYFPPHGCYVEPFCGAASDPNTNRPSYPVEGDRYMQIVCVRGVFVFDPCNISS
ncbi:MAG: DNA adenine methylase [Chloroflexi bacterium]|nr:DNA adenine methylase [Chloroflexota bacterium]